MCIRDRLKHLVVRGRMERVDAGENILCYIDYAHNAMSLAKVLKMLRIYEPERILLVFGCGGNRAGSRRSGMGRVAVSYTHLRAHETGRNLVCRLLLEKKKKKKHNTKLKI